MKKILAIAIITVMAAVLCVNAFAATELMNKAWDAIYVDGKLVSPQTGGADVWIGGNEVKGEINEISVSGWAFLSTPITGFAYTIDDGEAVKSADFIKERNDVHQLVHEIAEGFEFTVNVSEVGKGAHTLKIYAVDENGDLVDTTFACPFTQEKEASAPSGTQDDNNNNNNNNNPATADMAVVAVAAVACIALAGVVIFKKVR